MINIPTQALKPEVSRIPRWLIPLLKTIIGILLLAAICYTCYVAFHQINENTGKFKLHNIKWIWFALSGVIYAAAVVFPASYWYVVLRYLGQSPTYFQTVRAHIIGHIGKYVPGKFMVVLMRTSMLHGKGTETSPTIISIFLEGFVQMATGALLVLCVFLWWAVTSLETKWLPYVIPLMVISGLPFFPPIFKKIVKMVVAKKYSDHLQCLDHFRWTTILFGLPLMAGYWMLLALSYWALLQGLSLEMPLSEFPRYLATIASAMVAGFVLVFMPGGLGVREAFTVPLMAPFLEGIVPGAGVAVAVIAAIILRLVWLTTELMFSAILFFVKFNRAELSLNHCFPWSQK
ncbi:MAG: lysylphosphatidylglycerol synthase transmembrane domain-containing protein [Planctomycetia bacterium]|nr:lysylphosphatidylglycerol synthase transmembrane domain-containing protein [Planctomycetia bacterium]